MNTRLLPSLLALSLALVGCRDEPAGAESTAATRPRSAPTFAHEFVFLGPHDGEPVAVSVRYRSTARDSTEREHSVRGWLARDSAWEGFVKEGLTGPALGNVWQIVPHGALRIAAGGPAQVEALWYRRGSRRFRVEVGQPLSGWSGGRDLRQRLFGATLLVAREPTGGVLLESLAREAPGRAGSGDRVFITSGDSLRLVVVADSATGESSATLFEQGTEHAATGVSVTGSRRRALTEARRGVPTRWHFRVPELGLEGEVTALGGAADIGGERGGQRRVEAHYTVAGWLERGGVRVGVVGVVRHRAG